ncbi:WhiB family transcriptional regulator [Streptomyces sp. NPDC052101]|uniref:WhiB family transcriptional regulator n=1 Tax=Streptomyces sp. NPDC052101 TaxID=3155763 RepID=UPI00343EB835
MTTDHTTLSAAPDPRPGADLFAQAPCRGLDPELFFPVGEGFAAAQQVRRAKAVCAGCPVRRACLREALRLGDTEGIWAGLTAAERRELHQLARAQGPLSRAARAAGELLAGRPARVRNAERPAVALALLGHGWSEERAAGAVGVSPHVVRQARETVRQLDRMRDAA